MTARRYVPYFQYLPGISASGSRKPLFPSSLLPDSKTQILLRQELFCCERLLSIVRRLPARHPGRPCPIGRRGQDVARNAPHQAPKIVYKASQEACLYDRTPLSLPSAAGAPWSRYGAMALPPAGPLPPRRPPLPGPIPLGYVRLGLLPARRRLLPGLFRPPHSFGNKAVNRPVKSFNCLVKSSSCCICAFKRAPQAAE